MTADELSEMLESLGRSTPYKRCDEAAAMLRKQVEAIKTLREALEIAAKNEDVSNGLERILRRALAATEELK